MKAFMLSAGVGSRLRPLTERVPKCLVPIGGRPLLAHWLDLLWAHGVDEILVNTHHLQEQVVDFFARASTPIRATLSYEPALLGSAGTLLANRSFFEHEDDFFVIYSDNLTDADLTALRAVHQRTPWGTLRSVTTRPGSGSVRT